MLKKNHEELRKQHEELQNGFRDFSIKNTKEFAMYQDN